MNKYHLNTFGGVVVKKVVIAGGSGFLGTALSRTLVDQGYEVVILSRRSSHIKDRIRFVQWDAKQYDQWANEIDGCDALINFTGRSINAIYTKKVQGEILSSRLDSVKVLHEAVSKCINPPKVFIQVSAVGIYGDTMEVCDESSPSGKGFLANVCQQWEQVFLSTSLPHTRQVILRIGFVLGKNGGALEPLMKLTKLHLGGTVGSGKQMISWIHLEDLIGMFLLALEDENIDGVYNATAPNPASNKAFMQALRKAMGKGWAPPAPAPIAWIGAYLIMQSDPSLALDGTNAIPKRFMEMGYPFHFSELDAALKELIS